MHWCDANGQDFPISDSPRRAALRRTNSTTNNNDERKLSHDLRNHIHQSLLRRPAPPFLPCPDAGAGRPVYARLPRAPITGSPVPHLTSLYHFHRAGEYGDRNWPGNCGGNLIKDLLNYFKPALVLRPNERSAAPASDVCEELGIPCMAVGHPPGFRRLRPEGFPERRRRSISSGHTRPTGG